MPTVPLPAVESVDPVPHAGRGDRGANAVHGGLLDFKAAWNLLYPDIMPLSPEELIQPVFPRAPEARSMTLLFHPPGARDMTFEYTFERPEAITWSNVLRAIRAGLYTEVNDTAMYRSHVLAGQWRDAAAARRARTRAGDQAVLNVDLFASRAPAGVFFRGLERVVVQRNGVKHTYYVVRLADRPAETQGRVCEYRSRLRSTSATGH
ncbi:hypothetical protein C8Q80DRAFT_1136839 [Daedaleopsis nitida]|nr:hypothetical protein C8Q80DRAFT_1136839 [Daedaleopsis nitida]